MPNYHEKILLGKKKRGFGVNTWNGFGGKLKPGESVEDAMKREVEEEINDRLERELNLILSPETGMAKIRNILESYRCSLPTISPLDSDDCEMVFQLYNDQLPTPENEDLARYLYVYYYRTDEGYYEFYAELCDSEGLDDIMESIPEDDETDDAE